MPEMTKNKIRFLNWKVLMGAKSFFLMAKIEVVNIGSLDDVLITLEYIVYSLFLDHLQVSSCTSDIYRFESNYLKQKW